MCKMLLPFHTTLITVNLHILADNTYKEIHIYLSIQIKVIWICISTNTLSKSILNFGILKLHSTRIKKNQINTMLLHKLQEQDSLMVVFTSFIKVINFLNTFYFFSQPIPIKVINMSIVHVYSIKFIITYCTCNLILFEFKGLFYKECRINSKLKFKVWLHVDASMNYPFTTSHTED